MQVNILTSIFTTCAIQWFACAHSAWTEVQSNDENAVLQVKIGVQSHVNVTKGCPTCTCDSPISWPGSGCSVECGAKCETTCCCLPGWGACSEAPTGAMEHHVYFLSRGEGAFREYGEWQFKTGSNDVVPNEGPMPIIDAKKLRFVATHQGTADVADWFMDGITQASVLGALASRTPRPDKLNFATRFESVTVDMEGNLCILSGIRIAQGQMDQWWIGGDQCNRYDSKASFRDNEIFCLCSNSDGVLGAMIKTGGESASTFVFEPVSKEKAMEEEGKEADDDEETYSDSGNCGFGYKALCPRTQQLGTMAMSKVNLVMSHDSGTGYLGDNAWKSITGLFFQTQTLHLEDQLSCGVRALDLRVLKDTCDEDNVFFTYHHASDKDQAFPPWVYTDGTIDSTFNKVIDWAGAHPDEFVLVVVSHCFDVCGSKWEDGNCNEAMAALAKLGAKNVKDVQETKPFNEWTLDEAKEWSKMENGGHVLIIGDNGAFNDQYSKYQHAMTYGNLVATLKKERTWDDFVRTSQAFLQQDTNFGSLKEGEGITIHTSPVNELMSTGGIDLTQANLVEINFVCHFGLDLALYLGTQVSQKDQDACKQRCGVPPAAVPGVQHYPDAFHPSLPFLGSFSST